MSHQANATLGGSLPDDMSILIDTGRNTSNSAFEPDVAFRFHASEQSQAPTQPNLARIYDKPFQLDAIDIACLFYDDHSSPFRYDGEPLLSIENPKGADIRGRLASLAQKHFEEQHRLFLWHIVLSPNQAHIIRWDRAGAVVSEGFNPTLDPWIFRLLWRYSQATPRQRGFDESARKSDDDHFKGLFESAIIRYRKACQGLKRVPFSHEHVDLGAILSWPIYKVDVPNGASAVRPCLVGRPFYAAHSPVGRGTRVYVAYDLVTSQLQILKDAWRPEYEDRIPEHVAYKNMKKKSIEFVPEVICGGDIPSGPEEPLQATTTQDLAVEQESAGWRRPCATTQIKFRKLVHYRILEDIALPLEQLNNSCELLMALRDIATGSCFTVRRRTLTNFDTCSHPGSARQSRSVTPRHHLVQHSMGLQPQDRSHARRPDRLGSR